MKSSSNNESDNVLSFEDDTNSNSNESNTDIVEVSLIDNLISCLTKDDTTFFENAFENAVDSTIRKENDFFKKDDRKNLITLLNICKYDKDHKRISKIYNALCLQPNDRIENMPLLIWAIIKNHLLLFNFLRNNDATNLDIFDRIIFLVAGKENIHHINNNNITALRFGAKRGDLGMIRCLLDRALKVYSALNFQPNEWRFEPYLSFVPLV